MTTREETGQARPAERRGAAGRGGAGQPGALDGLQLMHIGATVAQIEPAMALYDSLGAGPWAVSEPIDFTSYDGDRDAVVPQRLRLAFGRMPGGVSIELVEPGTTNGPQGRLLAQRPGLNHVCYWTDTVSATGRALLDAGATVFAASSGAAGTWARGGRPGGLAGLIDAVPTATLRLPGGLLVEVLSCDMWHGGGLESFFGPAIRTVLDPPPPPA